MDRGRAHAGSYARALVLLVGAALVVLLPSLLITSDAARMGAVADLCCRGTGAVVAVVGVGALMLVTALNPYIGYDRAAAVAKEALATGKTLREVVLEQKLMDAAALDRALDPATMTQPNATAPGTGGG